MTSQTAEAAVIQDLGRTARCGDGRGPAHAGARRAPGRWTCTHRGDAACSSPPGREGSRAPCALDSNNGPSLDQDNAAVVAGTRPPGAPPLLPRRAKVNAPKTLDNSMHRSQAPARLSNVACSFVAPSLLGVRRPAK
jgi:hypothetical protein